MSRELTTRRSRLPMEKERPCLRKSEWPFLHDGLKELENSYHEPSWLQLALVEPLIAGPCLLNLRLKKPGLSKAMQIVSLFSYPYKSTSHFYAVNTPGRTKTPTSWCLGKFNLSPFKRCERSLPKYKKILLTILQHCANILYLWLIWKYRYLFSISDV